MSRVHVLQDGRIIVMITGAHLTNVSDNDADAEHTLSDAGGPMSTIFIGEVLADGTLVQLTGDAWSRTVMDNYDETDLGYNWITSNDLRNADDSSAGEYIPGKLYNRAFAFEQGGLYSYFLPLGQTWYQSQSWTDGTDLYFSYSWGFNRVFKVDMDTLNVEWIAGRGRSVGWDAKVQSKDNWDGKQADFVPYGGVTVADDGYAYWCEVAWKPISQENLNGSFEEGNAYVQDEDTSRMIIRRMELTAPYKIETVWDRTPSGYPSGDHTDVLAWAWTKNSATGLPNMYNSDTLVNGGQQGTGQWFHCAAKGDAIYILHGHCIRKWTIGSQNIETLLWGQKPYGQFFYEPWDNALNENYAPGSHVIVTAADLKYNRDHIIDMAGYPQGYPDGNKRVGGAPSGEIGYEGLMTWLESPDISGDYMYFVNFSGDYDPGSIDQLSQYPLTRQYPDAFAAAKSGRICRINLVELEEGGTQRINRENPQWESIANTTHLDDTVNQHNRGSRTHLVLGVGNRSHSTFISSLTAVGNTVYYLGSPDRLSMRDVLPDTIAASNIGDGDWWFVHRAGGDFEYDVILNFSGDVYQGYAEQYPLKVGKVPRYLE